MNANVMILLAGRIIVTDISSHNRISDYHHPDLSTPGRWTVGWTRAPATRKCHVTLFNVVIYLHERFDETGTVPRILVKVEPIETGQRDERHLSNMVQWMSVNLCLLCLTWDTCVIMLASRESHSSWVRPEQGRLRSGLGIYIIRHKQSCDKAVFCRVWNKQAGGNTVCAGDNCIIYGIGVLRALEMVKPL